MKLTLGQIADWLHAEGEIDAVAIAQGYSIDSRTVAACELFFAVRGERVDGHDYVEAALKNGAVAAVVSMRWLAPPELDSAKLLRVPDEENDCVLAALQTLAHEVRRVWGRRVIGVTGSAGKTTTKDCIATVLSADFRVLKTEGNLNNHFGLPLQLLRLEPEDEIAVLEMGMNHAGEIAALCRIAEPDWAVVSNVAPVHLEFFSDGLDGIARAKRELVEALPSDGVAFLNGDDLRVAEFGNGRGDRAVLYGTRENASVRAVEMEDLGLAGSQVLVKAGSLQHSLRLRLLGRHNMLNALAAISVGLASGIPLARCCEAMETMQPAEKRGAVLVWHGARIINDCYNSNPHALNAMVSTMANSTAERRILIAGEMLELGPEAPMLHEECGRAAALAGIDVVIGVRGLARDLTQAAADAGAETMFFEAPEEAGEWMREHLREGDLVLLKGSRGVRLERALEALRASEAAGMSAEGTQLDASPISRRE